MTNNKISVEDVPLNSFHRLLTFCSGGGSVVDGYILSVVGVVMLHMTSALQLSEFWQGLIAASALIGIFFGGFIGGWLTDRLGRKRVFFVGPTIFILASIAQFWVESAPALFALRLLIGIAIGIEYPVATALLVEFLPKRYRGPRLAMLGIMFFLGAALAYVTGTAILASGIEHAWRWVLASSAVFGAVLFIARLGAHESPRWLMSKGRHQEAEAIIRKVYGKDFGLANLPEQPDEQRISIWALLRSGYGKRVIFVVVFWTCSVIPVFAVYAFAPNVLDAMNLKGEWASLGSIAITGMFLVGCVIATRMVNSVGRRSMLLYSFLLSGIALVGLGLFHESSPMVVLTLFGAYALLIGGAQVLQLLYPNELFPTEIRARAVGVCTSLSRIGAATGTYLVPVSLQSIGIGNTMLVAALVTFFGLVVSWFMAPETGSMSLRQASSLA